MKKIPWAEVNLNVHRLTTYQSRCGSYTRGVAAGYSSTKGLYFVKMMSNRVLLLGRDGVAKETNKEIRAFKEGRICKGIGHALKARLGLAPLDVVLTAVTGTLGTAIHGTATAVCLGGTIVTLPLALFRKTRIIPVALGCFTAANGLSTLACAGGVVAAPLELVVPEVNTKLLKTHHWGQRMQGVD